LLDHPWIKSFNEELRLAFAEETGGNDWGTSSIDSTLVGSDVVAVRGEIEQGYFLGRLVEGDEEDEGK